MRHNDNANAVIKRTILIGLVVIMLCIVVYNVGFSLSQVVLAEKPDMYEIELDAPERDPTIFTSFDAHKSDQEDIPDMVQIVQNEDISPVNTESYYPGFKRYVPDGVGACHPYMAWQLISDPSTPQYQLRMEAESYDENDFGKIGDRYAVAVKPYYGKIGDYIDVIQEDGSIIYCIIAEYKGDENRNVDKIFATYYHTHKDVVEFIVNQCAWYGSTPERTVYDYHPEWNQNIDVIYNVGNYWGG